MMRLYHHYDAGHLPLSGGLMEQPNNFLESMEKLGGEFARIRREKMEKAAGK